MRYEETWKVLADLITELRKKGAVIPASVMNDLRSAKTMIQIFKADPSHIKNIPRIETYLENVEFYLISMAQEKFGSEFVEHWMGKLGVARKRISGEEEVKVVSRFVSGLPRGKCWVRVQVSEDTPQEDIENLAEENGLLHKMQENGFVLVYGDDESVKSFIKRLRLQQDFLKRKTKKSVSA
ncbi:DUF2096 domain-containing protein [Candidatus Bathyarchaeota archaeon]|nr:MAG: DUF2096 domain-containing protein [Candidatus Bathyarchaeota archaeon]